MGSGVRAGVHVVAEGATAGLAAHGLDVRRPTWGVLDVLRMLDGHRPEPSAGKPLFVGGLDALARASSDSGPLLRAARSGLLEGREYFAWKQIPLVFVVAGEVVDRRDGSGLLLDDGRDLIELAPLLGAKLEPAKPGVAGWWWAPQLG